MVLLLDFHGSGRYGILNTDIIRPGSLGGQGATANDNRNVTDMDSPGKGKAFNGHVLWDKKNDTKLTFTIN